MPVHSNFPRFHSILSICNVDSERRGKAQRTTRPVKWSTVGDNLLEMHLLDRGHGRGATFSPIDSKSSSLEYNAYRFPIERIQL